MSKDKQPEIRFPGFAEDWEERKLSDVASIVGGGTPSTSNPEYWDGDIDWYAPAEIGDQIYVNKSLKTITELGQQKSSAKILPIGTVLFTSRAGIGNTAILAKEGTTNQGFQSIVPHENKLDSYFIFSRTHELKRYGEVTGAGSTFAEVSGKQMAKMPILIPYIDEQRKIGAFFGQIDETIALHQRKLDLLKETKKGFLQKMFPKNGAKVPEIRFPGFSGDWELCKLSGVIEKLSGGASIKPTDYLEDGIRTIPKGAVNATGIADLSGSKYISEDFFEKNITSHVHTNNLVTSLRDLVPSAPNMGRIVRIEGDEEQFLMPQGVYKLELFEGMDGDFLISFSNSDKYRKIISAEKNGSTQVHIRNGEFLNIDINLPSKHEQKKIGTFFKQIDDTITLHQRKLDLLKETKKGFLQKMFV
ncbi:restriction endonuclease subunit S [Enterococcus hirae]|uniref:restriction endonuclease subunit S n=1 Tax=Enterococcus hirae TaxID=1354 RepID=UPI000BA84276|nr:restriction endonuclease subunit S [Enterococcus hirae]ASV81441.1 restriction endonuclease subunit S [Enterococcus hirae]MDD9146562.1 restriction endonuclease subunit S [Enterococcus hirae]MEB5735185.1 restriction endonuclease subunit S [Enterococcus hirae]MEC4731021.1 restriction endonuclease subunit S [Enterococcus hirae]NAA13528.1 restriction endonuclease subunit S [Enterococcus hirae]